MIRNDPDLQQALVDLAPVFDAYRAAKRDMDRLDGVLKFAAHNAARAQMQDQLSIIHGRAEKLAFDGNGLVVLLAAQAQLRARLRKRPSSVQMSKALGERCAASAAKAENARKALAVAQEAAAIATRNADAAQAARLLYTGYSS